MLTTNFGRAFALNFTKAKQKRRDLSAFLKNAPDFTAPFQEPPFK